MTTAGLVAQVQLSLIEVVGMVCIRHKALQDAREFVGSLGH